MAVSNLQMLTIIETMEAFLDRKRPPEHIRPQLDINYKIEDQSVIINEIRPQWNNTAIIREHGVAKATFIKSKNQWKVFWLRADLKWYPYDPKPLVKALSDFTRLVEEDKHHCFWG